MHRSNGHRQYHSTPPEGNFMAEEFLFASQIKKLMQHWNAKNLNQKIDLLRKLKNLPEFLQRPPAGLKPTDLEDASNALSEAIKRIRQDLTSGSTLSQTFEGNWKFGVLLSRLGSNKEALKYIQKAEPLSGENVGKVWHKKLQIMFYMYILSVHQNRADNKILEKIAETSDIIMRTSTDTRTHGTALRIKSAAKENRLNDLYYFRHHISELDLQP
jgi:hypothetical protein